MADEKQVNPRIPSELYKKIQKDSKEKSIPVNTVVSNILEFHYKKQQLQNQHGNITTSISVLKKLICNNSDPKILDKDTSEIANEKLAEMRLRIDVVDCIELHKMIMEWHNLNELKITSFANAERIKYVSKHNLGSRWSEFQCHVHKKMFEKIGETVTSYKFDSITFTIVIAKPKEVFPQ